MSEFIDEGVTAATISRMRQSGLIVQLSRGLYQLPNALLSADHSLAEATKLVPRGIVCLNSALAFHGLTDRIPPRIWMAIGFNEWRPVIANPPIIIVRFNEKVLNSGLDDEHMIERVPVRIYSPAKTVVDLFRWVSRARRFYGQSVSLTSAIQGLKEALRLRKSSPSEIAKYAVEAGIWKDIQPYLAALTTDS